MCAALRLVRSTAGRGRPHPPPPPPGGPAAPGRCHDNHAGRGSFVDRAGPRRPGDEGDGGAADRRTPQYADLVLYGGVPARGGRGRGPE